MERSEIRGAHVRLERSAPHCASLHAGYDVRRTIREAPHARHHHQNPLQRRRRIRLLPRDARRRRGKRRRWFWPRRCTASTRTSATSPTNSPGHGYIAAAPDLFWRSLPGPLAGDDKRAQERSQPRLEKIKAGEVDMVDTLAHLRTLPQFNGRAAAMGFCYGGPYAILGPKRLGYDAGISCHGTRLIDFIDELKGVTAPVCIIWGELDHAAPGRGARRLSPGAGADAERRGAHLPGHPARLHDALEHQGLQRGHRARSRWGARLRSSTGCAAATRGRGFRRRSSSPPIPRAKTASLYRCKGRAITLIAA
jgi:dienelactone hydrolase